MLVKKDSGKNSCAIPARAFHRGFGGVGTILLFAGLGILLLPLSTFAQTPVLPPAQAPPAISPGSYEGGSASLGIASDALVREALRYDFGAHGTPRDLPRAIALYRKAAGRGSLPAMMLLSQRYEIGRGVPQDDRRAVLWLRRAAHGGYPPAEDALGDRYAGGVGLKKDDARAIRWYLRAARHGYGESQDLLGLRYERGEGVRKNLSRARYWYDRAARDAGNPDAFARLGLFWEKGLGGPKSLEKAYVWDVLAKTTLPSVTARYRAIEKRLSPKTRKRLDREAADFLARYRPGWSRFRLAP
ncbi:MAG: tetratricopeptide repeat protein [Leptospirillia bacterium]